MLHTFIILCESHKPIEIILFFMQTVSILEQRLTCAEDKLKECIKDQQKMLSEDTTNKI